MTPDSRTFSYRFFDKRIHSPIPLPLLDSVGHDSVSSKQVVNIRVSYGPIFPLGKLQNQESDGYRLLFDGASSLVDFGPNSFAASLRSDGLEVLVHPYSSGNRDILTATNLVGDRIVTGVLPLLPSLWGTPALHSAGLKFEKSVVMLMGKSGSGKSTLSQVLVKKYGWHLLDDDVNVPSFDSEFILTSMGAKPRLRGDAAKKMAVNGRLLEGYADQKIALNRDSYEHAGSAPRNKTAVVLLSPDEPADSSRPHISRIAGIEALPEIWKHIFLANTEQEQTGLRFILASQLADLPVFRARYARDTHTPASVCSGIVNIFS